jgi:alpha-L-rhamnosidase
MNAHQSDCLLVPLSEQREGTCGGYPGHWNGRFIWVETPADQEPVGKPLYRMFRKTFTVNEGFDKAVLRITAGDKFIAYCNGKYLGRGPCRSVLPQWSFYDSFDLTPHLRQGKNTIAVMVFWHGMSNCFCADQRAGLWAETDVYLKRGEIQRVFTGPSWKTCECRGWDTSAPRVNGCQGLLVECYRAGVDPADWAACDFDDSAWSGSFALSVFNRWEELSNSSCWEYLEPRLTPVLEEFPVKPVRLLQSGYTSFPEELAAETAVAERLAKSEYQPQSLPSESEFCSLEGKDPYIVVDIGRPYNGVPCIEFEGSKGDIVEIAFSNVLRDGRCPGVDGVSLFAVRYVAADGLQSWQPWNAVTAFRYMTLVFRTGGRKIKLKSGHAIAHRYPVNRTGSFACSDKTLTDLWTAAIETNLMHLQDTYIMDPVRERAYYMLAGEIEQSHLCYYVSCGDLAATETHFKLTPRAQLSCGKLSLMLPNSEHRGFSRDWRPFTSASYATIPAYAVFYSQSVVRRQMWFPKPGFIESQYPVLIRIAEWLDRQRDANGLLFNPPPINWLDWTLYEKWNRLGLSGAMLGYNSVYVGFLRDLAWCAEKLGYSSDKAKWLALSEKTAKAIRQLFWDEKKGLFSDFYTDQGRVDSFSEMLNGLAILYGVPDDHQKERIVEAMKNRAEDVTPVSPLYMFYVAEALCSCGQDAYVFDYMSRRYAPVIGKTDFPTLPEGWGDNAYEADMGFVSIHGGGGGVAFTLSTRILGVTPMTEGFKRFRFCPLIGNLDHAQGIIPSPAGLIEAAWRREDKQLVLSITVPNHCECHAEAPAGYQTDKLPTTLGPGKHRFTASRMAL